MRKIYGKRYVWNRVNEFQGLLDIFRERAPVRFNKERHSVFGGGSRSLTNQMSDFLYGVDSRCRLADEALSSG